MAARVRTQSGGLRLVAAVGEELGPLPGTALGVGVVAAAAAAGRFLSEARPDGVIFVGTAGAYPGGPRIGTVIVASAVALVSGTATLGQGYVPRAPGPLPCDPGLITRLGLPTARVVTALAITTNPALARRHAEHGEVEHMESYGVAWACAEAGVPFAAVLGIANDVGPDAHAQWLHHRIAMQRAAQLAVARILG